MKRILAILLSIALLVTALPVGMISKAEGSGSGQTSITLNADDARIHRSADGVEAPATEGGRYKLETNPANMKYDVDNANRKAKVCIYNLKTLMTETIGTSTDKGINRYPYVVTKINVKEADYYNIKTEFNMNSTSVVDNIAIVVDGVVHTVKLQKGTTNKQIVGKEIYLSAGEHSILYMSVMPQNESDCPGVDANHTNATCYPWANFWSFTFEDTNSGRDISKSLEVLDASTLTGTDVENIFKESTRIEAEDTQRVNWNIYSKTEDNNSASGGKVVGGPAYANCKQTFEQLTNDGLDKAKTPYLQYRVEAPATGEYYLTIGANVGTSTNNSNPVPYVAVLVNDNAPVKAQFDGAWNKFDSVTVPVQLQEGINVIRCTSVTPDQYSTGTAWVNLDYFEVQKGLTVKPIVTAVTNSNYADYLFLNGYALSGTYFGQAETNNNNITATIGDLRYDYPSLYGPQFGIYSNVEAKVNRAGKWPYIAFKIHAEQSGEYTISTKVNMKPENTVLHQTFGMIVDGATYVLEVEEGKETSSTISQKVYLTAGEHVVVFTVPMPRDAKTASNYSDGATGNNTRYTWFNYHQFSVSDGLIFSGEPNSTDIQSAMTSCTRVEAENEAYVAYNLNYGTDVSKAYNVRYNSKGDKNTTETYTISGAIGSVIDDSASVTENSVNTTQTYADIEAGKLDKELTSYIHYVVKAEKAGTYVLRVGAYVEGSGTMPYGTILVNGKAYKAQFSGNWNGWDAVNLPVELKAGINAIQCVGVTADQTDVNGWIGYDYLDIPEGLTACDIEVKATDSDYGNYLCLNRYKYQADENNFGGPNYEDMRYDYPSLYEEMLGIYSDVKTDRANCWPYIAFTVRAEQAGEYEISANIGTNGNAKTIGMLVDGAMHVIDVTATSGYMTKSVYLTAGEHVIIFTSPIFRDMASRPTTTGTNAQYPYLNYKSFKLSAGLCFVEKPVDADIQTAMTNYLRVEAEDVDYASAIGNYNANVAKEYVRRYNSPYTVKVKGATGAAIDGIVTEAEKSVNTEQSYIEYKIHATTDGTYVLRVGAYVECSQDNKASGIIKVSNGSNTTDYPVEFPVVNTEAGTYYGYDAVNIPVELKAGENTIRCIGVTDTNVNGWIGYDYLEIPRGLTYHDAGEYTHTPVKSGLTFEKRVTYETDGAISQAPYTISAWVYLPSGYTSRGGVIFGNYKDGATPCVNFEIMANGVPRFYHINGDGKVVNLVFDGVNICADEWTNLTFTISGNTVSCYKNGVLAATITSTDNIEMGAVENQYVLGGDLRQEIATNGTTNTQYFKGRIIDVALYGEALSEGDVSKVYKAETITAEPYTRYKLENAEKDKDVTDVTGSNNLKAKTPYFKNKAELEDYAYSFAVVGDTQIVTENDVTKGEKNLSKIYDWILANKKDKKIQYVFGLGDITDNNTTAEWVHAQKQISELDGNIAYSVIRGNHDLVGSFSAEDKTADYLTQYLGTEAYKSQFVTDAETGKEGGFYDNNISNSWRTFEVGQVKYLMLALDFGPSDDVLNWAGDIIKAHPNHNVIITTHAYLYRNGTTLDAKEACPPIGNGGDNNGDDIWNKLVSKYENIILVMSGHDPSDNIVMSRDVGVNGNVVTSMLIDPQGVDSEDGSTGMVAMLYFSEDGTKVQVEYISTVRNEYFKEDNQFSFEFKIDDCDRKVEQYSAQEVAEFKTNGTYPKVEGYLFAGWYTNEACDEESLLGTATPSGNTYALFVPKDVLDVKAQISGNLLDSKTDNDDTASIRFVTTIDSLLYQKVGFKISYTKDGEKKEVVKANGTVYQQLYAIGSESKIDALTPNKYFCGLSKYFKACTITNIGSEYYGTEFAVTPFWVTMDGVTVYGDTVTKTVNMGIPGNHVWVSNSGTDDARRGTYEKPYQSLNYALSRVNDGGTIHIKDELVYAANYTWDAHGKDVIITGDNREGAALNFSAMSDLSINDGVTFRNIKLIYPNNSYKRVFAEGHKLIIESTVTVENKGQLLGGSRTLDVESTHLEVYSGNYSSIYGGTTNNHNVTGDTHVIVGGNVNVAADVTSHSYSYCLYGAGYNGTVSGNTYVTIKEGAKFNYVYGGGQSATSVVEGSTNIEFAGKAMSIYGGSDAGTNADTHVIMTGGEVEQIFGGCENTSMTGNTDVRVLGGTVHRRIYGGCYNEADETVQGLTSFSLAWTAEHKVTGYTSVTIADEANLAFDYTKTFSKNIIFTEIDLTTKLDNTLSAFTRHQNVLSGEKGVLIFNDDLYSANSDKIKFDCDKLTATSGAPTQFYNYLVIATQGGEVTSAGDRLYIKPDSGYVATIKRINADKSEIVLDIGVQTGEYQLPALESEQVQIKVEFSQN